MQQYSAVKPFPMRTFLCFTHDPGHETCLQSNAVCSVANALCCMIDNQVQLAQKYDRAFEKSYWRQDEDMGFISVLLWAVFTRALSGQKPSTSNCCLPPTPLAFRPDILDGWKWLLKNRTAKCVTDVALVLIAKSSESFTKSVQGLATTVGLATSDDVGLDTICLAWHDFNCFSLSSSLPGLRVITPDYFDQKVQFFWNLPIRY